MCEEFQVFCLKMCHQCKKPQKAKSVLTAVCNDRISRLRRHNAEEMALFSSVVLDGGLKMLSELKFTAVKILLLVICSWA